MFVEQNGILVIEAESASSIPNGWGDRNTHTSDGVDNPGQAAGDDFLVWGGDNHFGNASNGVITYQIEITTPGLYQFQWHSQIGKASTPTTEHNDTWLKINSDQFYGYQEGAEHAYVRPHVADPGSYPEGAEPTHGGGNAQGFLKVFSSNLNWTWSSKTNDGTQHDIYAQFDEPGFYEIQIAGRSTDHVIDRLVLHHEDYEGNPLDLSLPESEFKGGDTPEPGLSGDVSVFLLDAAVNSRVDEIEDGDVFTADQLYRDTFSLAVETTRTDVNSARLTWLDKDGRVLHREVDNTAELYTLFGDEEGSVIYEGPSYKLGMQSLRVELFTGRNANGTKVVDETTDFTLVKAKPEEEPRKPSDPPPEIDPNGLAALADHIVFSYDGNEGDPDDIAAMPIVALMAKAAGIEDKTSFYYGNAEIRGNPVNDLLPDLEKAADFSRDLGINSYSYQEDVDGTIARLVDLLQSGQKVLFIEGGRLDAIHEAMKSVDPALHSNVTMLSHSIWNENGGFPTWTDMQVAYPDITYVRITDQNNGPNNTKGFRNEDWVWMDGSGIPAVQDARDLMELVPPYKLNDPSDAGMLYYALTGEETGGALDVKSFIENSEAFGGPSSPPVNDPRNRAPIAVDDSAATEQNKTIQVDVLANDRDPDGDNLRLTKVDYVGTTSIVTIRNGEILVNPKSSATNDRTEVITYTVTDGKGGFDQGTLRVDIGTPSTRPLPTNEAPIAVDDSASTEQNKTIRVDVLANDRDPDGDRLELTDVGYNGKTSIVSIENGRIVVNPLKSATEARIEVITYTISDGQGGTDEGVLKVNIGGNPPPAAPINRAPIAEDDLASTTHNKTISVDVLANDRDADGDALTLTDVRYDDSTALVSIEGGKIVVNPLKAATTARTEVIEYTVTDGEGGADTGTLEVDISGAQTIAGAAGSAPQEKLFDVFLADIVSDEAVRELENFDRLLKSDMADNVAFYVAASDPEALSVDYVELTLGEHTRTERVTPYALFGDEDGDFMEGADLSAGKHELEYKAYADGKMIEEDTITFWVA